jgi:hypothetical protein
VAQTRPPEDLHLTLRETEALRKLNHDFGHLRLVIVKELPLSPALFLGLA